MWTNILYWYGFLLGMDCYCCTSDKFGTSAVRIVLYPDELDEPDVALLLFFN